MCLGKIFLKVKIKLWYKNGFFTQIRSRQNVSNSQKLTRHGLLILYTSSLDVINVNSMIQRSTYLTRLLPGPPQRVVDSNQHNLTSNKRVHPPQKFQNFFFDG